eukprot:148237_1
MGGRVSTALKIFPPPTKAQTAMIEKGYMPMYVRWERPMLQERGLKKGDFGHDAKSGRYKWALEMYQMEQPEAYEKAVRRCVRASNMEWENVMFHPDDPRANNYDVEEDYLAPYYEVYDRFYGEKASLGQAKTRYSYA